MSSNGDKQGCSRAKTFARVCARRHFRTGRRSHDPVHIKTRQSWLIRPADYRMSGFCAGLGLQAGVDELLDLGADVVGGVVQDNLHPKFELIAGTCFEKIRH